MRHFLSFILFSLVLVGCHRSIEKKPENLFPIKLDLKSYTVVNYIPLRKGNNLDHLLELEKWAQAKGVAAGLQGEGVLALLEGRASLEDHPTDTSMKRLTVDVIFSFEFKNQPAYGKGKTYFRLSEENDIEERNIPAVQKYIQHQLQSLDRRFLSVMMTQFPQLKKAS